MPGSRDTISLRVKYGVQVHMPGSSGSSAFMGSSHRRAVTWNVLQSDRPVGAHKFH